LCPFLQAHVVRSRFAAQGLETKTKDVPLIIKFWKSSKLEISTPPPFEPSMFGLVWFVMHNLSVSDIDGIVLKVILIKGGQ
jgi:hypothetical protein